MSFWIRRRDTTGKHLWLIEVHPVTVLLVGALATCFFVSRLYTPNVRSQQQIAKIQIMELKSALELFHSDVGRYPSSQEGLSALIRDPGTAEGWNGPYTGIKEIPADPWSHPYVYRCPGKQRQYDLLSFGHDGKEGGSGIDQDITY